MALVSWLIGESEESPMLTVPTSLELTSLKACLSPISRPISG
jgi:hypothetical protein